MVDLRTMTKRSWIPVVAAFTLSFTAGCKKEETTNPDEVDADEDEDADEDADPADADADADGDEEPAIITKASFDEVIHDHFEEVSNCYLTALEATPDIQGKLGAIFTFDADGGVASVTVAEGSTLTDEGLVTCIHEASKGWDFGKPNAEGMTLRFDFNLAPG